jgi:hypothetical protein
LKQRIARLIVLAIAVAMLGTTASVNAQSNGLGVTPRKDYTVKAGDHINDKLFISNLSQKDDLRISIRMVDFSAQDETGTPALQLAPNAAQTPWSLKPFLKIANTLTVPAGKSTYLPFNISIPKGQGAGSYYSAIEYVAENAQTQQKVNIAASTASLVFVTVPGSANEQLTFKQFGTYVPSADDQTGKFQNMFTTTKPKTMAYRLQNNGNVAEQPQGSIIIKNMFGKTTKTIDKANPKNQLALRGQTRRFEVCINEGQEAKVASNGQPATQTVCKDPSLMPGRYTAKLAVLYGLNGNNTQEVTATASFWYLPWWSIAGAAIVVLLIVALIWMIIRKIRKHTGGSAMSTTPTQPLEPADPSSLPPADDDEPMPSSTVTRPTDSSTTTPSSAPTTMTSSDDAPSTTPSEKDKQDL